MCNMEVISTVQTEDNGIIWKQTPKSTYTKTYFKIQNFKMHCDIYCTLFNYILDTFSSLQ